MRLRQAEPACKIETQEQLSDSELTHAKEEASTAEVELPSECKSTVRP